MRRAIAMLGLLAVALTSGGCAVNLFSTQTEPEDEARILQDLEDRIDLIEERAQGL